MTTTGLAWSNSVQAYLCAHANNQQYTAAGVPAWGTGSGPVVGTYQFSLTVITADSSPLYLIVNNTQGRKLTLPYLIQDGDDIGPVGVIGQASSINISSAVVSAPSGDTGSLHFVYTGSAGNFEGLPGPSNVPGAYDFVCNGAFEGSTLTLAAIGGTNDDLQSQFNLALAAFVIPFSNVLSVTITGPGTQRYVFNQSALLETLPYSAQSGDSVLIGAQSAGSAAPGGDTVTFAVVTDTPATNLGFDGPLFGSYKLIISSVTQSSPTQWTATLINTEPVPNGLNGTIGFAAVNTFYQLGPSFNVNMQDIIA